MQISRIRLSPASPFPESFHKRTRPKVETGEARPLLLFGFLAQLLSPHLKARRGQRFPKGKLRSRVLCRRLAFQSNQLPMLLTPRDAGQGSFAPRRLDRRLSATMNPSDAANRPHRRLWLPAEGCPWWTPIRASQVPDGSVRARCLLSPRGVRRVHLIAASPPMQASSHPADWPLPISCNEAEPSSRVATARALAFPSVNGRDRSLPLWGRLHDFRSFIMVNTLQFTRTTKLRLALSKEHRVERRREHV